MDPQEPVELPGSEVVPIVASREMDFEARWTGPPRRGSVQLRLGPPAGSDQESPEELVDPPTDLSAASCDLRDGRFRLPFRVRFAPSELDGLDDCVPLVIRAQIPVQRGWDYDREAWFGIIDGEFGTRVDFCAASLEPL